MANATRSRSSIPSSRRKRPRRLSLDRNYVKTYVIALTTKDGRQDCWPEFFETKANANRMAKWWLENRKSKFSTIADAQVRQVLRLEFMD
jgi:hypothetical protein